MMDSGEGRKGRNGIANNQSTRPICQISEYLKNFVQHSYTKLRNMAGLLLISEFGSIPHSLNADDKLKTWNMEKAECSVFLRHDVWNTWIRHWQSRRTGTDIFHARNDLPCRCGLTPRRHWSQNRHNTANQHLSGHTSPDTCGYI